MNELQNIDAEHESAVAQRTAELENEFSYDGYQVVRKELFAHLRDPAITIRKDSVTFNTACINGMEDVVYIHMMFNKELKRIVVEGCDENDKDALRWCVAKPDKRKSRKMMGRPFSKLIYREMGWEEGCRYKILGYRIQFEGKTLYVFDLNVPEVFLEKKRKKKTDDDIKASEPATVQAEEQPEVNTRKGYYPDDIANTFGVSVEQHREETAFHHMDGYVAVGVLTGSPDRRGEAQGQRPFAVPDAGD